MALQDCVDSGSQTDAIMMAFQPDIHTRDDVERAIGEFKYDEFCGGGFVREDGVYVPPFCRDTYDIHRFRLALWMDWQPDPIFHFRYDDDDNLTGVNFYD